MCKMKWIAATCTHDITHDIAEDSKVVCNVMFNVGKKLEVPMSQRMRRFHEPVSGMFVHAPTKERP